MTPEQHGRAIERAAANIMREPTQTFRNEAAALGLERRQLGQIIGAALTQEAQRRRQLWFGGAGLVLGFMLFPLIAALAPGGSYLAALARGETNRWQAGGALMREAGPEGWREFVFGANLARANSDAIRACGEAAAKAGKEQKCTIIVTPPARRASAATAFHIGGLCDTTHNRVHVDTMSSYRDRRSKENLTY